MGSGTMRPFLLVRAFTYICDFGWITIKRATRTSDDVLSLMDGYSKPFESGACEAPPLPPLPGLRAIGTVVPSPSFTYLSFGRIASTSQSQKSAPIIASAEREAHNKLHLYIRVPWSHCKVSTTVHL